MDKGGDKKKKDDKIKFVILNENGDTIRQFSRKIDKKGLVRMSWGLETDGVESPSRRDREEDADPPRGDEAMPGIYKTVIMYGDLKDSITVEVKMDPRLNMTAQDLTAMKSAMTDLDVLIKESKSMYDKVKKAKKSVALIEKLTETLQDTTKKEWVKLNKEQSEKLAKLDELFFDKENQKGIQRNSEILTSYLFGARRYIRSSYGKPGGNAMVAFDKAKEKFAAVKKQVDDYFMGDYPSYKEKVSSLDFKLFEE
jgi:hypothetical protein